MVKHAVISDKTSFNEIGYDPELEAALGTYEPKHRPYSVKDEEKIRRYWGKVDPEALAKKLNRTTTAIREKAGRMGLIGGAS